MTQATIDRIRAWMLPAVVAALVAVCSVLWTDMRQQINDQCARLSVLNDAVVRLTTLQEKAP